MTTISTVRVDGTCYLALTYVGRTDDPELVFTVQAGDSPSKGGVWTDLEGTELEVDQTDVPSGFCRVMVRDCLPMAKITLLYRVSSSRGEQV